MKSKILHWKSWRKLNWGRRRGGLESSPAVKFDSAMTKRKCRPPLGPSEIFKYSISWLFHGFNPFTVGVYSIDYASRNASYHNFLVVSHWRKRVPNSFRYQVSIVDLYTWVLSAIIILRNQFYVIVEANSAFVEDWTQDPWLPLTFQHYLRDQCSATELQRRAKVNNVDCIK